MDWLEFGRQFGFIDTKDLWVVVLQREAIFGRVWHPSKKAGALGSSTSGAKL